MMPSAVCMAASGVPRAAKSVQSVHPRMVTQSISNASFSNTWIWLPSLSRFQLFGQAGKCVAIELMISEDIDDRRVQELSAGPLASFQAKVNVAGKHNHVCIGSWQIDWAK